MVEFDTGAAPQQLGGELTAVAEQLDQDLMAERRHARADSKSCATGKRSASSRVTLGDPASIVLVESTTSG
ncbi:MAG: hypothetical protein E6J90_29505 [Deltaproteobacteria bacterium]|nr:MAG: hypothetical protein E6J90_29505 [Deltaproteobacteria bacterium]